MLKTYLKEIYKTARTGDAREESYYKPLATLIESYANSIRKSGISATISPQRTEAGNPDFRIWDGRQSIVGYIEAKRPEESNLDRIEESDQLQRYLMAFPNVILTNFFEFRLYRNAQLIDEIQIARPFIATQLKVVPPVENEEKFYKLLKDFFSFSIARDYSPRTLAEALACRTHFLKDQVLLELKNNNNRLTGFYQAFQQYLIAGLTKQDFADMYAQTVTYGLFAASTRQNGNFTRKTAFDNIPATIGILRDVFRFISLEEPSEQLSWIIDDISDVLSVANVKKLLHRYFIEGRGSDPIVHFYETFLVQYDPDEREQRGVYYTPEDVVGYIVRSLNIILKEYFEKADGFACENVTVLDPAAGTLTFLAETAKTAVNEFSVNYGSGGRDQLIKNHILKNFYAFELMMAPYAVGHLKMSFLLEELGYKLHKDDRFKLYLTNTLELEDLAQSSLPGMSSLSEESYSAGKVKKEQPILVILGNPPYSGHSANKGKWISKEIREYYKVDGKDLGEKNPKWLQDDYVKFIRFAQWKIDQAGEGVLGFITNHSYLDNPTFRGMRQSLMNSFDHIHILDLHGNSKKKEKCPDGSKDRNVFDIQQGVAIIIAVKKPGLEKKISHADLWGLREEKSIWLKTNNINSTKWKTLSPKSPFYFFVPRDEKRLSKYEQFSKITDIFPVNSVGIVTSRDRFAIDADKEELKRRINMFRDDNLSGDIIKKAFNLKDKARWKVKDARSKIRAEENWEEFILPILYRPFDKQWIFYHDTVIERTRKKVMSNVTKENLSLLCCRQQNKVGFRHAFISDNIVESCIVSDRTREIGYTFPIYTYPTEDLYNGGEKYQRDINIDKALLDKLTKTYGRKSSPEKILCYIYAVLYCNVYRNRYAEFLKSDFPRIPFTADPGLFSKMARYGGNLIELHLLKSKKLEKSAIKFHGRGDRRVEKIECNEKKKLVKINPEQYFGPLSAEIWQYQIGGYQVMEKWLKDRKGKCLDLEDIKHYCRMATALKETMATQKKIDATYNEIEQHIIAE
jgi:type I restriction-modification system DNA methylase subunit